MQTFLHPDVERSKSAIAGRGLIARKRIAQGTVVIDYSTGSGVFLRAAEAEQNDQSVGDYGVQVDDDLVFVPQTTEQIEDADFVNHSCDPTCGFHGSLQLVAIRDIHPGDEISFDYAMSESADYSIECRCRSSRCRQLIRGTDWQRPELQARYRGYFSPYLEQKIATINSATALDK